jgi:AMME syndrome candidate gene 1 protein
MAATAAQCAYCFECLGASFDKRKHLSLDEVELLWDKYQNKVEDEKQLSHRPPAITRLLDSGTSSGSSSSIASASSSTPSLNTTTTSKTSLFSVASRLGKSTDKEEYPLFVTYDIRSRSNRKELRGCIGTFEPHPLDEGLRTYALTS